MLAMGATADSADTRGQTPLMWAASSGNLEAIAALLKAGAQANRVTPGQFTPLAFAITSGIPEAAKMLLDAGADASRSEERRVGKECVSKRRSRWPPYHYTKHQKTQYRSYP